MAGEAARRDVPSKIVVVVVTAGFGLGAALDRGPDISAGCGVTGPEGTVRLGVGLSFSLTESEAADVLLDGCDGCDGCEGCWELRGLVAIPNLEKVPRRCVGVRENWYDGVVVVLYVGVVVVLYVGVVMLYVGVVVPFFKIVLTSFLDKLEYI